MVFILDDGRKKKRIAWKKLHKELEVVKHLHKIFFKYSPFTKELQYGLKGIF